MIYVVDAARALIGVPWRHMGRTRDGVDCLGLAILAYRAAGHDVPEPPPYRREPQGQALMDGIHAMGGRQVRPGQEAPGDVMLFRVGLYAGHVGVYSMHPTMRVPACIHAYLPRRRVVEEPLAMELAAHIIGAFRIGA